jgi:hypothetical protein
MSGVRSGNESRWKKQLIALLRPAFAGAAVGLALAIGICGGVRSGLESEFTDAFGMEVFSTEPPALPSTVLGHMR